MTLTVTRSDASSLLSGPTGPTGAMATGNTHADANANGQPTSVLQLLADSDDSDNSGAPTRQGFGIPFIDFFNHTIHPLIAQDADRPLNPAHAPSALDLFPEPPADLILSPFFASINRRSVGLYADYMTGNLPAVDYVGSMKSELDTWSKSRSQYAESDIHPTDQDSANVAIHLWSFLDPLFVTPGGAGDDDSDLSYRLASQLVDVYPLETEPATEIADENEFWDSIKYLLFTLQFQAAKQYLDANRSLHGQHTEAVKDLIHLVERADPTGTSTRTAKAAARLASLGPHASPALLAVYALLAGHAARLLPAAPCWRTGLAALLVFSTPRTPTRATLWTQLPLLAMQAIESAAAVPVPNVSAPMDYLTQLLVTGQFALLVSSLVHAGDLWLATHLAPVLWRHGPRDTLLGADVQRVALAYTWVLTWSLRMPAFANAYLAAARAAPGGTPADTQGLVPKRVLDYLSVALVHALGACRAGDADVQDLWVQARDIATNPVVMAAPWNPVRVLAEREEARGRHGWAAKAYAIARAWRDVDLVVTEALRAYVTGARGVEVLREFDVVDDAPGRTLVVPVMHYLAYHDEYGRMGVGLDEGLGGIEALRRMAAAQVALMNDSRWPWFFIPTLLLETLPLLAISASRHVEIYTSSGLDVITCMLMNCGRNSVVAKELAAIGVEWGVVDAQLVPVREYRNRVSAFTPRSLE